MCAAAIKMMKPMITMWRFVTGATNVFKSPLVTVDQTVVRSAK